MTFEQWLETDLGKEVYDRITRNRHSFDIRFLQSHWETDDDVHQNALLYLMLAYRKHGFDHILTVANDEDHAAAMLTRHCVRMASRRYANRKAVEQGLDESIDQHHYTSYGGAPDSSHDIRGTDLIDLRIDLERAERDAIKEFKTAKQARHTDLDKRMEVFNIVYGHLKPERNHEVPNFYKQNKVCRRTQNNWHIRFKYRLKQKLQNYP